MWQAAQHSKATLRPMSKKIRKETPPPPKKNGPVAYECFYVTDWL